MLRIAHVTDPHLPLPGRPPLHELVSKRFIGYSNWIRSRREIHRPELLETLIRDVASQTPDHIAVTGDLVNVASQSEFLPARQFLERLGSPVNVSLVPGNHDAYAGAWNDSMWREWGPWMTGDEELPRTRGHCGGFPWVRRRGDVVMIGLSSAITTLPFRASGKIGTAQMQRLAMILDEVGKHDLFRLVLIHHSPLPGRQSRDLTDATELCDILGRHGAELVLHGHNHVATLNGIHREGPVIPVLCAPSASAQPHGRKPGAGWTLLSIDRGDEGWRCRMQRRSITTPHGEAEITEDQLVVG